MIRTFIQTLTTGTKTQGQPRKRDRRFQAGVEGLETRVSLSGITSPGTSVSTGPYNPTTTPTATQWSPK